MGIQMYDRAQKRIVETPEVGAGAIRFAYGTAFGRVLAKAILCRKFVSNAYAAWQNSRFSRSKVQKFIKQYQIDLSDCETQAFPCFSAFFTRSETRKNQTAADELPAVADSRLTALPIGADSVFSVKGVPYTPAELLENPALAAEFNGGLCLIFRLAPDDYHRYAYPDDGAQEKTVAIPGVLHTVNPIAAELGVYRRNARRYTVLHTAHFGKVVQMEVGALLVGKICNQCEEAAPFEKLAEKGYFAYGGSTVILLLQKNAVRMDEDIMTQSAAGVECRVRMGERIGAAYGKQQ